MDSRFDPEDTVKRRKARKNSYNYLREESAKLGTSSEIKSKSIKGAETDPTPGNLRRAETEPTLGNIKRAETDPTPGNLRRAETEPTPRTSKDKNVTRLDVWTQRFIDSMLLRAEKNAMNVNRAIKDEAVEGFVTNYETLKTNYETLKTIHGCLYEPLRAFYKSDGEVSEMLTMHVSDIKWEILQETYQDTGRALDQLKGLDFDQDFQRLWTQMDQAKREVTQAKEKIEKEISFGRKGQAAMSDIRRIYNYVEQITSDIRREILPVLQDSRNPNPETLKENLSGLSGKIYNLAVKKAEGELQTAEGILKSIKGSQQPGEGSLHKYVENAHEHVKKARERLQRAKDGPVSLGTGKSMDTLIDNCSDVHNAINVIKLEKAVREFRKSGSDRSAEGVLNVVKGLFHRPASLVKDFQQRSENHWGSIARENFIKENGVKPTEEEFKVYYKEYLGALDKKAQELVEGTQIWTRHAPDTLLRIIRGDGRFKSHLETRTSRTLVKSEIRARVEQALFGYPKDLPAELRPIYGYLTKDKDGIDSMEHPIWMYGAVAICLKPNVKLRSTVVMGDSLSQSLNTDSSRENDRVMLHSRPVPYSELGRSGQDGGCFSLKETGGENPLDIPSIDKINPYAEAEIHGGLRKEDIEEVVFHSPIESDSFIEMLIPELIKSKIAYRFTED